MSLLPVIVGFGGINAAGRASSHHAYRRMVLESLPAAARQETVVGLTTLMNLATHNSDSTYGADSYLDTSGTHMRSLRVRCLKLLMVWWWAVCWSMRWRNLAHNRCQR
jgi:hypothetical protein